MNLLKTYFFFVVMFSVFVLQYVDCLVDRSFIEAVSTDKATSLIYVYACFYVHKKLYPDCQVLVFYFGI